MKLEHGKFLGHEMRQFVFAFPILKYGRKRNITIGLYNWDYNPIIALIRKVQLSCGDLSSLANFIHVFDTLLYYMLSFSLHKFFVNFSHHNLQLIQESFQF